MNSGFYQVGDKIFRKKIEACIYATQFKKDIQFIYFDWIWKNTQSTINAKLNDLYKLRAEQLRDEKDYLILNYSGGTDSWTILHTYLMHNIFLDEVVIKWPSKAIYDGNRNIHTPNLNNKHPSNYLTEWEAFMMDDIKLIEKLSPKTKITIYDFSDKLLTVDDKQIENLPSNHFISLPSVIRMGSRTESEIKLIDKKVASIYGVDKPLLCKRGNECFFRFSDVAAQVSGNNIVYFFWAPDMPLLLIEAAHRIFEWFQQNKDKQHLIQNLDDKFDNDKFKEYTKIANIICCPDYDYNRFQTDKPTSVLYNQKDSWCKLIPEYQPALIRWDRILNEIFSKMDKKFLSFSNGVIRSLAPNYSRTHKLGTFT